MKQNAQDVVLFMAVWMTVRSGYSVMCVRHGGT